MRPSHASTSRSLAVAIVLLMAAPIVPAQDVEAPTIPLDTSVPTSHDDSTCSAKVITLGVTAHWPIHINGDDSASPPGDALAGICATADGFEVWDYEVTTEAPASLGLEAPHVDVQGFSAGKLVIGQISLVEVVAGDEFVIADSDEVTFTDIDEPEAQVSITGDSDGIVLDDVRFETVTIDTSGSVHITGDFEIAQLIIKNGIVTLENGKIGSEGALPGIDMRGGSLDIGFNVNFATGEGICIEASGGSLSFDGVFWQGATQGACSSGLLRGNLDDLWIESTQFNLVSTTATLFDVDVANNVWINDTLFASVGHGVAFGGLADVDIIRSTFQGQDLPLTITGTGSWLVEGSSFSGLSQGLVHADGADAELTFYDNIVDGTPTFTGDPAFEDQVTVTLSRTVQPGTNVLGHGTLGGNAWLDQGLADGDGDGIAELPFIPMGLSTPDVAPIVEPNLGPKVIAWTEPDRLASNTLFDVGNPITVFGNATDADHSVQEISWRIYAAGQTPPPFNLGAESIQAPITFDSPGVHTIVVEVIDAAGAPALTTIDVFVEAANQAPVLDTMLVGYLDGSNCVPLDEDAQLHVGVELCMQSTSHDPDAGVLSRRDGIFVDSDGDGIAGDADARLDAPLPKGIAGYTKIRGQSLHPMTGGLASDNKGGLYIDLDCDGIAGHGDIRFANVTLPFTPEHPDDAPAMADLRVRLRDIDFDHGRTLGACQPLYFGFADLDGDTIHTPTDALLASTSPLPAMVEEGLLRIAPEGIPVNETDVLLGQDLIPLPDARLAWDDADGDITVTWRVGTALLRGETATMTVRDLGAYAIHAVATDRGVPQATAAASQSIDVISADPPNIDIVVTPGTMVDGVRAVTRAREVTIHDATRTEINTGIVSQDWAISWVDLDGTPHLITSEERPEWRDAEAITFTFDDHRIQYKVKHSVELRNGQGGVLNADIRVLRTPPTPVVEFTPSEGITFGDVVTFAAAGSIDAGDPLSHAGQFATVGDLLVADMDGNGVLSAPDMPFQTINAQYPTLTLVGPMDLDVERSRGSLVQAHVCLRDNDLDLVPDAGEELYIDLSGPCSAGSVMPGLLRIYSPSLDTGVLVDPNDADIGAATVHLPLASLAHLGGDFAVDFDSNGTIDAGDLLLGAEPMLVDENIGAIDGDAELAWAWGSLYMLTGPGASVPEGSLRLTSSFVEHPGMTVFGQAAGQWIGKAPLEATTRHVCYADVVAEDDAYTSGEPLFLTAETCSIASVGDVRLQEQVEATGGPLPAGSTIGTDSILPAIPHPDVDLRLRSLPAAQLAEHGVSFIALDLDGDLVLDAGEVRLQAVDGRDPASRVNGPTSSDNPGDDDNLSYRWECRIGCGDPKVIGIGGIAQYAFQSSGRKEVVLVVGDDDGNIVEQALSLAVDNTPPTPGVAVTRLAYPNGAETFLGVQTKWVCPDTCPPVAGANDRDTLRLDGTASSDPDGPASALLYKWTLPDGTKLAGPQVEVSFDDPGLYSVVLTVTDSDDLNARSDEMVLQLLISNGLPVADFVVKTPEPVTLSPVLFDAAASTDPGGEIVHYEWTFESDSGPIKRVGRTTTFTWDKPGTYDVGLRVFDDQADASETLHATIDIANRAPIAVAEVDLPARLPPAEFQFTARDSYDLDGAISSFAWDFGDGTTGSGADVSHIYATRGSFDVRLTVTDDKGASSESTLQVIVLNKPALLSVAIPSSATAGTAIPLEAVVQDPEKGAVSVTWTITDHTGNVIQELGGTSVQATFPNWGTYTITAVATDDAGAETTVTRNIKVASRPPVATLSADLQTVNLGETVKLTGSATDPDGTIKGHYLDFGDGNNVFASSAEHVYKEPGTFTVVYRATDDSQTTGTATLAIRVENPAPTITKAELSTQAARVGDILLFTAEVDDDTVETVRFHWDFKDGVVDTRQNAIHTYNVAGTFQVSLTVTDAYGKTAEKLIAVQVLPRNAEASNGEEDTPGQGETEPPLSRIDKESPSVPFIGFLAALWVAFTWRRR